MSKSKPMARGIEQPQLPALETKCPIQHWCNEMTRPQIYYTEGQWAAKYPTCAREQAGKAQECPHGERVRAWMRAHGISVAEGGESNGHHADRMG